MSIKRKWGAPRPKVLEVSRTDEGLGPTRLLTSTSDGGRPIVFGHYELEEPVMTRTKIGIDTAAYCTGILTAIRLPDRHVFQATRAR